MDDNQLAEMGATKTLSKELKPEEITQIINKINLPEGLYQEIQQGSNFITVLKKWQGHDAFEFYQSLTGIRSDLLAVACKVKWLCVSSPDQVEYREEKQLSIKTLIELLKNEVSKGDWELIYIAVAGEAGENVNFEITLNKLMEKGWIEKDLFKLKNILVKMERDDLVGKLEQYQNEFNDMGEGEFESKFKNELGIQAKESKQWQKKLKDFGTMQFQKISQMLGKEKLEWLESIFVELTILKQEPRAVNMEDETTYNEIAYLRKIANKEVQIEPVNFTAELLAFEPKNPEIWCLIGNPGCGKTFLAKRTALRFSSGELDSVRYSVSIPCRNTDWHEMETTRHENKWEIESEYISRWLCLGMPKGPTWAKDLSKHLTQSDGEGLLLIIDGLDEFTRKVPFEKTLLCLLLTRQTLTKSTIILTSRPGAWTDISSSHEQKIDRYYQVLGFSPDNRDIYFKKQITDEKKLKACMELMERHDEMKQLSLIPVNASLFAALLKGEHSSSFNTLTKLYYQLVLYLIRRELSRMCLHEFSKVTLLSELHCDIQVCLKRIGFIAFLGVANRDLMSEETVPLIIGKDEYPSQCLGLAHEHYKQEAVGLIKKVWTFAHLTMQEFTAAHWLSNNTWTKQCASIRYISHSPDNFSLFRMLVRFLCGILTDRSAAILAIMYRYLTPQPTQMRDIPLSYQLFFDGYSEIIPYTDIQYFSEVFIQLTSLLFETDSLSVESHFAYYSQFFPSPLYLYFKEEVSPNEWFCFLKSLKCTQQIQLLHIRTSCINPIQFMSLLKEFRFCIVKYLAITFRRNSSKEVLAYTDSIRDSEFSFDTKISIDLSECDMSDPTAVGLFSPTANQKLCGINLLYTNLSDEFFKALTNQITALDCIGLPSEYEDINSEILLPNLCQATQLRVIHLSGFSEKYDLYLRAVFPNFSNLQEIRFEDYSVLTALPKLSGLTYLEIGDRFRSRKKSSPSTPYVNLLQLMTDCRHTLRVVRLDELHYSGLRSWSLFLNVLSLCTNLVQLQLRYSFLPAADSSDWSIIGNNMKLLVVLQLTFVSLCERGFQSLCVGLAFHPTIRRLYVYQADLTSLSCYPLIRLIPTVTQLEELSVYDLMEPDEAAHKLLQETAEEYSIRLNL